MPKGTQLLSGNSLGNTLSVSWGPWQVGRDLDKNPGRSSSGAGRELGEQLSELVFLFFPPTLYTIPKMQWFPNICSDGEGCLQITSSTEAKACNAKNPEVLWLEGAWGGGIPFL